MDWRRYKIDVSGGRMKWKHGKDSVLDILDAGGDTATDTGVTW